MHTLTPAPEVQDQSASRGRALSHGMYLAIVLLLPLALFLAAFPIARSDYFLHTSRRMLWHAMAYHMALAPGTNCDVVIFGDSTGLTGLDPRIIEADTGLQTCNLGLPYMAVSATGTRVLDHYLAENRPPQFIVFANHITHLRAPALDELDGVIDGWWFVDRTFPPLQAAKFFLAHPHYSFLFAAEVWQRFTSFKETLRPDFSERTYRKDMSILRANRGFFENDFRETADQICHPLFAMPVYDRGYLEGLKSRYATAQTQVIAYVSPVAGCDARLSDYMDVAHNVGVAPPLVLPANGFADDRHLDWQGTRENSKTLAQELLSSKRQ